MNETLERSSSVHQSPLHIPSNDVQQNCSCAIWDNCDVSQSVVFGGVVVERFEDVAAAGVENQNHTSRPRMMMNGDDAVLERVYLPYY